MTATHTLSEKTWSHTAREWLPAGTPVLVTLVGKGGAAGSSRVTTADGKAAAVVKNIKLLPITG